MSILDPSRTWQGLREGQRAKAPRTLTEALRRGLLRPFVALTMGMVAFGLTQVMLHVTTGGGTLAVGGVAQAQGPVQETFAVETTTTDDLLEQITTLFVDHGCTRSRAEGREASRALVTLPGDAPMVVAASVGEAIRSGERAGVHHAFCP